jgi:hypothetical protein
LALKGLGKAHEESKRGITAKRDIRSLESYQGSYIVIGEDIAASYGDRTKTFTLDINRPYRQVAEAAFDLGLVKGIMVLDFHREGINIFQSSQEYQAGEEKRSQKRKWGAEIVYGAVPDEFQEFKPRRLQLHWRGRDMDGRVKPEEPVGSFHCGFLDFTDDTLTKFEGQVRDINTGFDSQIIGYKVDDEPRQKPKPWNSFPQSPYALDCINTKRPRVGQGPVQEDGSRPHVF